jgi:hypothetical protein
MKAAAAKIAKRVGPAGFTALILVGIKVRVRVMSMFSPKQTNPANRRRHGAKMARANDYRPFG